MGGFTYSLSNAHISLNRMNIEFAGPANLAKINNFTNCSRRKRKKLSQTSNIEGQFKVSKTLLSTETRVVRLQLDRLCLFFLRPHCFSLWGNLKHFVPPLKFVGGVLTIQ